MTEPLAGDYDRLWTDERMWAVIAKAVEKDVALEIQAESPYSASEVPETRSSAEKINFCPQGDRIMI